MQKAVFVVAALALSFGTVVATTSAKANPLGAPHALLVLLQGQADPNQPAPKRGTFTGTIKKAGGQLALADDETKSS